MKKTRINEHWRFQMLPWATLEQLDGTDELPSGGWETVTLPHTWYSDEAPYRGLVAYCRTVRATGEANYIEFNGADQCCKVYAGGKLIGSHQGGYSRFRVELPDAGETELVVLLDNRLNVEVSPCFGDFTVFGGLYRDVFLIEAEAEHFDYLYYGTDGVIVRTKGDGTLSLEPHAVCSENATVAYAVRDGKGKVVCEGTGGWNETVTLRVEKPRRWNGLGKAQLYTVEARLCSGGVTVDEMAIRTGFRSFELTPDKGAKLNGRYVRLRGVAKHQDQADVFNAVPTAQIQKDFDLIGEIGANAVRLSHYQHPQKAYELCDEMGLLAWAEIPMLKMTESNAQMENAMEQLHELILQNIHHPSIFCWGIQNEIAMFSDAPFMHEGCRKLNALVKALDPERYSACANLYPLKPDSALNAITDMLGYNIYFGWYYGEMGDYSAWLDNFHAKRPEVPLGVSEYGVDSNLALHSETPQVKDYSEEYQALWHETVYPILESKQYLWGTFIWNMFDFSSANRNEGGTRYRNCKGLVTCDRQTRKDAFWYYRAKWSEVPTLHLCAKRFIRRAQDHIDIKVYTNQPAVTLTLNGKDYATAEANGNATILFHDVPLRKGENSVRVCAGALSDETVYEHVDTPEASYALPDSGAGTTVKNWFLPGEEESREGYYSILSTAYELIENAETLAVLKRRVPALTRTMTELDVIPLGLSLKSILGRDKTDGELVRQLNRELNQIKNN